MIRTASLVFLVLVVAGSPTVFGKDQGSGSESARPADIAYDVASFASELHRIATILKKKPSPQELAALRESLPERWKVSNAEGAYSIPSEPLREQLREGSSDKAKAWISHLAEELESSMKSSPRSPQARTELARILARPEFGDVRPPNALELLRQRMAAWFERMLMKFFGGLTRYPIAGEILFWLLVIAAVGISAMLVLRFFASRDRVTALPAVHSVIAVITWQEWIRAAREAARLGNFREAIHCAYWGGIFRLEDLGVVPKDRTKTPREYLRMVVEPSAGQLAPSATHRESLKALTSEFEQVWYANRGVGIEDFRASLSHLEALGCSLE